MPQKILGQYEESGWWTPRVEIKDDIMSSIWKIMLTITLLDKKLITRRSLAAWAPFYLI